MVKIDVFNAKFDSINKMLLILREHQKLSLQEFLEQQTIQLAVEHALFVAIQSLLDLGSHILADREIRNIADYRDVLVKLGREMILPPHFAESIVNMASFRNRLIHEYEDVNPKLVYEFLQTRLGDFEEFMRHIRDYFRLTE